MPRLRAAAVGLVDGLTWQEIVEGLALSRSQLRLMTVRSEVGGVDPGRLLQRFSGIDVGSAEPVWKSWMGGK